jgi:hypothetical protein
LITLTLFDEQQVTKVDSLQGSIRDIQSKVRYWQGYEGSGTTGSDVLKTAKMQTSEALKESEEYLLYLENEISKKPEKKRPGRAENDVQRKNVLLNASAVMENIISELANIDKALAMANREHADSIIRETVPLVIQTKLTKAKIYSYDLLAHIEARSKEHRQSMEHMIKLTGNVSAINSRINALDAASPPDMLNKGLDAIEKDIEPLKKQSPYTLLMMRIVEIGLPLLLSLLALLFAVRYSLSDKRTFEIKELLKQRNRDISGKEGQS